MRHLKYMILFIVFSLSLYLPILSAGFAADDYPQLVNRPYFHHLNTVTQIFDKVIASQTGHNTLTGFFYRPFTFAVYILIYNLFSANPFYFHLLQLLLFACTGYLLFLFFTNFFSRRLALLLSGIFLIHPVNNELAAYIAALGDTFSLFFGLLALNLISKSAKIRKSNNTIYNSLNILLIASFLFLSLLSKETGLLFIFLCLIYLRLKLQPNNQTRKNCTNFIATLLPLFLYLPLRLIASSHPMFVYLANPIPNQTSRLVYLPQIILAFFSEILAPTRQPIHSNFFQNNVTADILPTIIILGITVSLYFFYSWIKSYTFSSSGSKTLLIFYLWIGLGLILYLQIAPLEFLFADRWVYITEIGFLGVLGIALTYLPLKRNPWTTTTLILSLLVLLLYAGETIHLNFLWHDWQHYLAS